MLVHELSVTAFLQQDMHHSETRQHIGFFLNCCMEEDKWLCDLHTSRKYKHYVFNNLYPIESDGIYKKGRVYLFRIRSTNQTFAEKMQRILRKGNHHFQVLAVELKVIKTPMIEELITITPIIVTVDGKPWLPKNHSLMVLQEKLEANGIKKYKDFTGKDIPRDHNFIKMIHLGSRVPIATHYKGIKLLGHKMTIKINEDALSQEIGQLLLGSGIGEKNSSIGAGYCYAKYF